MTGGSAVRRYGALAQMLHWGTVLLVGALVGIAITMDDLPLGPEKFRLYNLHKSIGLTVLALTLLRLLWRRIAPPPALPAAMPDWERRAAQASHFLLYAILLTQPLVGVLHSWSANFPILVYGWFAIPNLTGPNKALEAILGGVHWSLGWGLVCLVLLHAAAALRHHFLLKDDVLRRMLPGRSQ